MKLDNCSLVKPNVSETFPEVLLEKGVLKISSKFTGENPYRSVIPIRHGCSPTNLLHMFRTQQKRILPFPVVKMAMILHETYRLM